MLDSAARQIRIEGMQFCYGSNALFRDFVFQSDSRVTVLRGPSGCGKTTLLKLLYGLLTPASVSLWKTPAPAYLVLQSDSLVPWFSGRENIEKFSSPLWQQISEGPFHDLITPFINKKAWQMSYGQRRTIELARAFSSGAPLLLLDEPFNFLDPEKRRFFINFLNGRSRDPSFSRIVLTSHYVEDVPIAGADSFEFTGEMPYQQLTDCIKAAA